MFKIRTGADFGPRALICHDFFTQPKPSSKLHCVIFLSHNSPLTQGVFVIGSINTLLRFVSMAIESNTLEYKPTFFKVFPESRKHPLQMAFNKNIFTRATQQILSALGKYCLGKGS